jgi:hypothetical protein
MAPAARGAVADYFSGRFAMSRGGKPRFVLSHAVDGVRWELDPDRKVSEQKLDLSPPDAPLTLFNVRALVELVHAHRLRCDWGALRDLLRWPDFFEAVDVMDLQAFLFEDVDALVVPGTEVLQDHLPLFQRFYFEVCELMLASVLRFVRADDNKDLAAWAMEFAPGPAVIETALEARDDDVDWEMLLQLNDSDGEKVDREALLAIIVLVWMFCLRKVQRGESLSPALKTYLYSTIYSAATQRHPHNQSELLCETYCDLVSFAATKLGEWRLEAGRLAEGLDTGASAAAKTKSLMALVEFWSALDRFVDDLVRCFYYLDRYHVPHHSVASLREVAIEAAAKTCLRLGMPKAAKWEALLDFAAASQEGHPLSGPCPSRCPSPAVAIRCRTSAPSAPTATRMHSKAARHFSNSPSAMSMSATFSPSSDNWPSGSAPCCSRAAIMSTSRAAAISGMVPCDATGAFTAASTAAAPSVSASCFSMCSSMATRPLATATPSSDCPPGDSTQRVMSSVGASASATRSAAGVAARNDGSTRSSGSLRPLAASKRATLASASAPGSLFVVDSPDSVDSVLVVVVARASTVSRAASTSARCRVSHV